MTAADVLWKRYCTGAWKLFSDLGRRNQRHHGVSPRLLLDDCDAWTLNASLTRLSSYRKCSKRRILGHSAQATSLLPIEGTTKCSQIARGLGFGSNMEFVVVPDALDRLYLRSVPQEAMTISTVG